MLVNEDYSTQNALNDTNHEYDSDTDHSCKKLSNSCRNIVKQMLPIDKDDVHVIKREEKSHEALNTR